MTPFSSLASSTGTAGLVTSGPENPDLAKILARKAIREYAKLDLPLIQSGAELESKISEIARRYELPVDGSTISKFLLAMHAEKIIYTISKGAKPDLSKAAGSFIRGGSSILEKFLTDPDDIRRYRQMMNRLPEENHKKRHKRLNELKTNPSTDKRLLDFLKSQAEIDSCIRAAVEKGDLKIHPLAGPCIRAFVTARVELGFGSKAIPNISDPSSQKKFLKHFIGLGIPETNLLLLWSKVQNNCIHTVLEFVLLRGFLYNRSNPTLAQPAPGLFGMARVIADDLIKQYDTNYLNKLLFAKAPNELCVPIFSAVQNTLTENDLQFVSQTCEHWKNSELYTPEIYHLISELAKAKAANQTQEYRGHFNKLLQIVGGGKIPDVPLKRSSISSQSTSASEHTQDSNKTAGSIFQALFTALLETILIGIKWIYNLVRELITAVIACVQCLGHDTQTPTSAPVR